MMLAVAVFLLQLQAAPAAVSAAIADSLVRSASTSADRTLRKIPDSTANTDNSDAFKPAREEPSSTSSALRLRMDSIYSDDRRIRADSTGTLLTQNSQSFSTIRIPEANEKRYAIREAESVPARREWLALALLEHSAASFDAYTTRQAISRGAVEQDPLMRPFAQSPAMYAAVQVGPVLFDLLARHMQRSQYNFERRTWWVPQTASTGLSIFAGVHNLGVPGHL
jgi:hypothetical protein